MKKGYIYGMAIVFVVIMCLSCVRSASREGVFVREDLQCQLDSFISENDEGKEFYNIYLVQRRSDTLAVFISSYYFLPPTAYLPIMDRGTEIYLLGTLEYRGKFVSVSYVSDCQQESFDHLFAARFNKEESETQISHLSEPYYDGYEPVLLDDISQSIISFNECGVVNIVQEESGFLPYPIGPRDSEFFYCRDGDDTYLLRLDYESYTYQLFHNGLLEFGIIQKHEGVLRLTEQGIIHNSVLLQRPVIASYKDTTTYDWEEYQVQRTRQEAWLKLNNGYGEEIRLEKLF